MVSTKQSLRLQVGEHQLSGEIYLHEYPYGFWVGGVTLSEDVEVQKEDSVTVSLSDGRMAEGKVMEQRDARSLVITAKSFLAARGRGHSFYADQDGG